MFSPTLEFADFPKEFALLIIICGTLAANLKDIKDIKGDAAIKTKTVLVIFGEKLGKKIIGIFMFLAIILAPLILKQFQFLPVSLFFGITMFLIINNKNYREKLAIGIYFTYVLILLLWYVFYL